jgi:DNA invertase Pin-like site-specific DNA recombinase
MDDKKDGGDDKKSESDSVTNQRKMLDSFIESHPDIEIVDEKVDDGVSGIIFDRPAFKEMMADIESGKINCVIVKDLSRLGREYIETGRYLRKIFPAYGVRFIAILDNIDTLRDSGDDIVVSIKSVINDAYCRDISTKTRSALNAKRENGDFVAAFPVYGYRKAEDDKNRLVIDEYPASVVRDIFRMKLEGQSALKISETLNSLGILSPLAYKKSRGLPHAKNGYCNHDSAKWSPIAIIRILNDETYTGTLIQGRQSTVNYKIRDLIIKPEAEWKRTEGAHEAIIKKHDYNLAQKVMRLDTRTAPGSEKVYIFSGVLICGSCGARMTRKTNRVNGREYHYYYCPTTKKRGCTAPVMLKEDDLTECVLVSLKAHVTNVASLDALLATGDVKRMTEALAKQYRTQIRDNQHQLESICGFKSTLYESMITGNLTKEEYRRLKADYSADEARLNAAIERLGVELDDVLAGKAERLRWMEHFKRFGELTTLDRRTVANLIAHIRVLSKTELQIKYNYQDEYEAALALLEREAA